MAGTLPYRAAVRPGRYLLDVEMQGYRTDARTIDVPPDRSHEIVVDIALARAEAPEDANTTETAEATAAGTDPGAGGGAGGGAATPDAKRPRERDGGPSSWNWVLAGGLAAAGAGPLVDPLLTAARQGDCVDSAPGGGCQLVERDGRLGVRRYDFGTRSGVLLGAGLLALGAAAYVAIARPLRLEASVSARGAALRLGAAF